MNFFTFLRRLFATEDRLVKRARLRPRTLLRLEALEDRIVPTTNIFTVTSVGDGSSAGTTPGTLRYAVTQADLSVNSADTNIINFNLTSTGASPYTIDLGGALNLTNSMTIEGLGANTLFISGNNASTVFTIGAGAKVELDNLTIEDGKGSATDGPFGTDTLGGGIYNQGILTINNSDLIDNSAMYGGGIFNDSGATANVNNSTLSGNTTGFDSGGGIFNVGTANVNNSTLSDNSAIYNGGGIFNDGTANIGNSTLSDNSATNDSGGGIYNRGTANIGNSTLSGNTANNENGGGVFNTGTANIGNSTLSGNSANSGGGIFNYGGSTANIGNSIVAQNNATTGADLSGAFTSQGYNLIGIEDSTVASGFTNLSNGDIVGTTTAPVDPKLVALGNNGGPTQTMALLPGSLAIGAGSNALIPIDPSTGSPYTTDQRGSGYARIAGANVDIGAFEAQQDAPTVTVADASGTFTGNPFTATGTAQGLPGDPANGTYNYAYYTGSSVNSSMLLLTAPTNVGTYTVVATFISGNSYYTNNVSAPVTFNITQATTTTAASNATTTFSTSAQNVTLTADVTNVTSEAGPVNEGTVTFTLMQGSNVIGTATTSGTVSNGNASVSYTLPAGTVVGSYTIDAVYNPGADYTGSSDNTHTLTVSAATPTVSVADASGPYTGNPFTAVGTALGVDGTTPVSGSFSYAYYVGSSASGTASATAPSAIGTYTVVATFTSVDPNYTGGTAQTTFTISPRNATSDVRVTRSGFYYGFPFFSEFYQFVTITNTSGSALTGPLVLQLTGLSSSVTLTDASGTNGGDPYRDIALPGGRLAAGQSVTVMLSISDPMHKAITYGTEVWQGI